MRCEIHNIEMKPLFTTNYCELCDPRGIEEQREEVTESLSLLDSDDIRDSDLNLKAGTDVFDI